MNAFINNATSSLSDEATQRTVLTVITATVVSYAVVSVCYMALAYALWAWLAFVIAAVAAMVAGQYTARYMSGNGYDHVVNAVASVRLFFAKKVAA